MAQTLVKVYGRIVDISTPDGQTAYQILRQCEIMDNSGNIINSSTNIETVIGQMPVYEKSLYFLTQCPDSTLKKLHLKSQTQLKDMYNSWLSKKTGIINGAVSRSCKASIQYAQTLKTKKGQFKHMIAFCDKSLRIPELSPESVNFLLKTKQDMENFLKAISGEAPKPKHKISEIEKNIHTVQICQEQINTSGDIQVVAKNIRLLLNSLEVLSKYSDAQLKDAGYQFASGSPSEWHKKVNSEKHKVIAQVPTRPLFQEKKHEIAYVPEYDFLYRKYHSYVEEYTLPGSIQKKLRYCEKALKLLPDIILADLEQEGEIVSIPDVCYVMPELYLRIGEWEQAKATIKYCIECNAYYSDPMLGNDSLSRVDLFRETALIAIDFIKNNPGYLQKNMYRALDGKVDYDCLKHFLRCSEQIKKIKNGATNELYLAK